MLSSQVLIQNNLAAPLPIPTSVDPGLGDWGPTNTEAGALTQVQAYWMSRTSGITPGKVWVFSTPSTVAGTQVSLQVRLTGKVLHSDLAIQVTAGSQSSGWSSGGANVSVSFTGDDGNTYTVTGAILTGVLTTDTVLFSVAETVLPQITNMVVLMMENRSLDNLLGWIYDGSSPANVLPAGSSATFDGLSTGAYSNSAAGVNDGDPVPATCGTSTWVVNGEPIAAVNVPSPDPGEGFADTAAQIAGGMGGFLSNYLAQVTAAGGPDAAAAQIMESYGPTQVPVVTGLATGYAVSDAWYASVPSQTWPNRCFLLCGSSGGYTDNASGPISGLRTVFDLLAAQNIGWRVYSDNPVSLVQAMFPQFWTNFDNFGSISDFERACGSGTLPPLTFIEPAFGVTLAGVDLHTDASYHPPFDVTNGEQFLASIQRTIQGSPNPDQILFVVLFDEHGGTYDHVEPPMSAQPPEPAPVAIHASDPANGAGYTFGQFGVRVPAILVSSYVTPGTVFRSPTGVPFDHTSVLATLRDWLGLQVAFANLLPSPRIAAAPTFTSVLGSTPVAGATVPTPLPIDPSLPLPPDTTPLNYLQRTLAVAAAATAAGTVPTPEDWAQAHAQLRTLGDLKAMWAGIQSAPPAA